MKLTNLIKITSIIVAPYLLLTSNVVASDDWTCTDVASIKSENNVMACGVATADDEGEAREKALRRARTEFELICETSAECVGKQTIVEPLRNSCETLANGRYKCFRGLRYTILDQKKPNKRVVSKRKQAQEEVPQPTTVRDNRVASMLLSHSEEKKFSIGVGSYVLKIALESDTASETVDFTGRTFFIKYAAMKNLAVKFNVYSMVEEEFEDVTNSGVDIQLLLGSNFTQPGGNFYFGVGSFSETWESDIASASEDFSGSMFILGLGYNWEYMEIDLHVSVRDESEYVDNDNIDVAAVSSGLALGFRF